MTLRYGSICSGIEAATVAWEPLGWTPAWFSEIEPFPSAVLAHHYPEIPNHGDFTKLIDPEHAVHADRIDLLVGGTPCQAFSVAGLRQGFADPRGGLTLDFLRLAQALQPRWLVWENVPGVLSQDDGRAFGAFLGGMAELGFGFAYRVLDAQYVRVDGFPYAVPQRRRRVFVVGCSGGDWVRAAKVLLVEEGVRGDSPPRRRTEEDAPARAGGSVEGGRGVDPIFGFNFDQFSGREGPFSPTLTQTEHKGKTIVYGKNVPVRRITPVEAERLQGLPDNYTQVPFKGKPASDGPRYKAVGNSMAVNVMRWIGRRIQQEESA